MGVKGFPTLKLVRPGKKAGRPVIEDYNGGRTAGAIVEAVAAKSNNHVTRVTDKDLDGFLASADGPKAMLFTDKGTTSALLRSIAIDYLGVIGIAQIRDKESAAVAQFGIKKFPTLVLVPGGEGQEPVVYEGEMKKADMVKFLSQAGEPNPDPAPAKAKGAKKKKPKKDEKPKTEKSDKAKEAEDKPPKAEDKEEPVKEAETSDEAPPAASTPQVIVIPTASSKQEVAEKCLQPKSHTCILALVPDSETPESKKAIDSLSQLNTKYLQGQRKVFPFIAVPDSVDSVVRAKLEAANPVELIAINVRRNWWRTGPRFATVPTAAAWRPARTAGCSRTRSSSGRWSCAGNCGQCRRARGAVATRR